ncbi:MAG: hypothetical protein II411_05020, partial [Lachnospiraceae bacterium]|nr:hypothetical protein [Lachnospiraceae bacterium]
MYILSLDLGSTNFKAVVLKVIENDTEGEIKLVGKVRMNITDFALFICEVIKKFDININEIEKIIVTGTGSSYIGDEYNGIEILKVNEFDAIGYGGIILSKLDEALIVSIGTGTTIVHSNLDKNVRIGGTGLGGGTLVGLGRAILGNNEEIYRGDLCVAAAFASQILSSVDNARYFIPRVNEGYQEAYTYQWLQASRRKINVNEY